MSILAAHWGWFLLGGVVLTVPAVMFGIRTFLWTAKRATTMNDTLFGTREPNDPVAAEAGTKGFAKPLKNMLRAAVLGIMSALLFILAAIGFIGWLIQR